MYDIFTLLFVEKRPLWKFIRINNRYKYSLQMGKGLQKKTWN